MFAIPPKDSKDNIPKQNHPSRIPTKYVLTYNCRLLYLGLVTYRSLPPDVDPINLPLVMLLSEVLISLPCFKLIRINTN